MAALSTIAVFIILTQGAWGAEWASVPDPVVHTCTGKTVSLLWKLTANQGQEPNADIRWFFHGAFSSELVAAFTFGQFLTGKSYSSRVSQVQHTGITIKDVVKNDEGNYTITVFDKGSSSLAHTVFLQVGEGMMTSKRVLEAVQDPVALWDSSSQKWTIRLLCGHFLFLGKPPIRIEWTLPNGETRTTASYQDGQFSLALSPPLVPEGNYTCRIPRHFYPEVCIDEQNDDPSTMATAATVYVDEIRARLTLSEAEQGRLTIENSDLKDSLQNLTAEMHYQKLALNEEIQELQNITYSLSRCSSYSVLDDARRDVSNTLLQSMCDTSLTTGWYRLYLDGQDAMIPDKCTPTNRCGAQGTGWLDLGGRQWPSYGEELEARICINWSGNCCNATAPAAVRNCGSFFLYRLQAHNAGCSSAYCLTEKSGCFSYAVLDDARRDVSNTLYQYICDSVLTTGWYRLYLNGQDAVLPGKCTPTNRCGTHGTGWLDLGGRNMPSYGEELEARICIHWGGNCCYNPVPAAIRNCGSFFVYRLQGHNAGCAFAYCLTKESG